MEQVGLVSIPLQGLFFFGGVLLNGFGILMNLRFNPSPGIILLRGWVPATLSFEDIAFQSLSRDYSSSGQPRKTGTNQPVYKFQSLSRDYSSSGGCKTRTGNRDVSKFQSLSRDYSSSG